MISENPRVRFQRSHSTGQVVFHWKVLLREDESFLRGWRYWLEAPVQRNAGAEESNRSLQGDLRELQGPSFHGPTTDAILFAD